ncbi:hydroxyisourate hydrolase [Micromonospora sp. KC207]|uniref:hydroxyisourate hydrolase n=1 Tax=Micromonospora sp. KC207 TaxID=2530377 RepID=UPI00104F66D3|nr:hydroxyisourate hydrolase [Micromonospora sp. KC207]TDC51165.1 hydroxyisourate hydrolase [Micromonospora sp. KC207]
MSRPDTGRGGPFAPLSTHVLDTVVGLPAPGIPVRLDRLGGTRWRQVGAGRTDADGRLRDWVPAGEWAAGRYRLVFDLDGHLGPDPFFPEVVLSFLVGDPDAHLHLPLLLSPFGYTTYRGS